VVYPHEDPTHVISGRTASRSHSSASDYLATLDGCGAFQCTDLCCFMLSRTSCILYATLTASCSADSLVYTSMMWGHLLRFLRYRLRGQKKGEKNAVPYLGEYEYAPLQLPSLEIRIFKILPGIDDKYVHGRLISVPMGKLPIGTLLYLTAGVPQLR
jgi:hypothetical protein